MRVFEKLLKGHHSRRTIEHEFLKNEFENRKAQGGSKRTVNLRHTAPLLCVTQSFAAGHRFEPASDRPPNLVGTVLLYEVETSDDDAATKLLADEMAEYRRPFLEAGDDRWPTLQWAREVPLSGEPSDVHDRIAAYSAWLKTAPLPKFFIDAEPGVFVTGRIRRLASSFPNQHGHGHHDESVDPD